MFDIAKQLFPNIVTIVVQLCATGVLYLLYQKYLHQSVLSILDKKAEDFQTENYEIEKIKKEQQHTQIEFERECKEQKELLVSLKKQMLENIEDIRNKRIIEAKKEAETIKEQAKLLIEEERRMMLQTLEQQTIDVAAEMVAKVLEGFTFSEEQIMQALKRELEQIHAQS